MKKGFITNIEKETLGNDNFRKVLYTAEHLQLVVMSLEPGEDIGKEIHETHDQFIRIESGTGVVYMNGIETSIADDDVMIIPAGAEHNLTNTGYSTMKLYTVYGPAQHRDGVVHITRERAEASHEHDHFDGTITEL